MENFDFDDEERILSVKELAMLSKFYGLRIDKATGHPKFYRIASTRKASRPSSFLKSGYMTTANHHINKLEDDGNLNTDENNA